MTPISIQVNAASISNRWMARRCLLPRAFVNRYATEVCCEYPLRRDDRRRIAWRTVRRLCGFGYSVGIPIEMAIFEARDGPAGVCHANRHFLVRSVSSAISQNLIALNLDNKAYGLNFIDIRSIRRLTSVRSARWNSIVACEPRRKPSNVGGTKEAARSTQAEGMFFVGPIESN
jgi:hypothetical protein